MNATAKKPAAAKKPGRPAAAHKPAKKPAVKKEDAAHVATAAAEHKKPVHKAAHSHHYAVGKRKTAVAQVMLSSGTGVITVNELPIESYFMTADLRNIVLNPMTSVGVDKTVNIRSKIHGGGIHAQAEALRHGIARAITAMDPESRRTLKKLGFLTRDPRVKERKKPGLKRARRAPQFSKR